MSMKLKQWLGRGGAPCGRALDDVGHELLNEIELFFKTYNTFLGREFHSLRRTSAARAKALIEQAHGRFADARAQ